MHRTEGLNNDAGLFTNGPPGTRVEENFLNALQEEICNVIEGAGVTLKTAATETRNQLWTVLSTLFPFSGLRFVALTAPPTTLLSGLVCMADRVTWDPLGLGAGGAYLVMYTGSAWTTITGQLD